jgi:beta-hydroxylase
MAGPDMMRWLLAAVWLASVLYVHCRGRVRLTPRRQLFDHSTFMAPINAFMLLFSKAPRQPFIPLSAFPELAPLRRHWWAIRAEAGRLDALRAAAVLEGQADPELHAFLENGWKYFYLKWYDEVQPAARRLCPRTYALLQSMPSIKVATFVELPPGARINRHRDPYAGFLRYHLGLATPNDDACFMEVDGRRHALYDGQAMLFDETYIHWARNDTSHPRIVLLCDIERPMRQRWAQAINHRLGRMLMTATNAPERSGRAAGPGQWLRALGRWRRGLKAWSMAAYRASMALLVFAIAGLLLWL